MKKLRNFAAKKLLSEEKMAFAKAGAPKKRRNSKLLSEESPDQSDSLTGSKEVPKRQEMAD